MSDFNASPRVSIAAPWQDNRQVLTGRSFTLIPFKEEHICDRYIDWLNDPDVHRYLDVRHYLPQTYSDVAGYVRSFYGDTERYIWGIYPGGSGDPIGTMTLPRVIRRDGRAGLGFMVGEKSYWGKGAATEAIGLVTRFVFETLGLHRLYAETASLNARSNNLFKKLGFTLEGELRDSQIISPTVRADTWCWGLLAPEWRARLTRTGDGK